MEETLNDHLCDTLKELKVQETLMNRGWREPHSNVMICWNVSKLLMVMFQETF